MVWGVQPEFGAAEHMITHGVHGTPRHSRESASFNAIPMRRRAERIQPCSEIVGQSGTGVAKVATSTEKRAADSALTLRIGSGALAAHRLSIAESAQLFATNVAVSDVCQNGARLQSQREA